MKAINAKLNLSLVSGDHEIAQEMLELFTAEAQNAIDISGDQRDAGMQQLIRDLRRMTR